MTELEVTQADRRSAANYLLDNSLILSADYQPIIDGRRDENRLVKAFAAHRIASQAELVEALENAIGLIAHKMGMDTTAMVAGQTLVSREVWSRGMAALNRARGEG